MITIYYKGEDEQELAEIATPRPGCWIHLDEASTSDITELSKMIGLEYTDLADCLDRYEIPRIERIDENVVIYTRHPVALEGGLYTTTFTLILTKEYFITISLQQSRLVHNLITQKPKIAPSQKSKFLLYILLKITQEFTLQIKKTRATVLRQEKKLTNVDSKDITNLTINEEILNQYSSSLVPMRKVLEEITKGRYTILYEEDQDLLEDLLNASIQSEDLCSINMRSIRSLRDSYQIIFTNQLNKTIKLLTALTIILSIPTMVASLYGMNVSLPIEKNPAAFGIIVVFITVLSLISLYIFQRKKWL